MPRDAGPYMYLHLVDFYGKFVGKYTTELDPIGFEIGVDSQVLPSTSTNGSLDIHTLVNRRTPKAKQFLSVDGCVLIETINI